MFEKLLIVIVIVCDMEKLSVELFLRHRVCIRYAAAEMDCTEAVTRDPAYVKAFCRRASARVALKNYEGARVDYQRVLDLEPYNRLAQTELKAIEQARWLLLFFCGVE